MITTKQHNGMTTKINLPTHLSEYLKGKFGTSDNIIRLPANSSLYHIVYELLQRRPVNHPIDQGNTEIHLPSPRASHLPNGKPVEYFNYISKRDTAVLIKAINTMLKAEAHEYFDENKHVKGIDYIESAYAFLLKYGIEHLTPEALLKDYQRWRAKIGRKMSSRKKTRTEKAGMLIICKLVPFFMLPGGVDCPFSHVAGFTLLFCLTN